jgi:hypothetical protein
MAISASTIQEIIYNCTKQLIDLESFVDLMNTDTPSYFHEYFTRISQDDDYDFESAMIPYVPQTDNWDLWKIFPFTPPSALIIALDSYFKKFFGGQDTYLHNNGITVPVKYADAVLQACNYKLASFNVEAPDLFEFGNVSVASGGTLVYTASGSFQTDDWSRAYGVNINPVPYTGYAPTTRVELYNYSYDPISFDIIFNCKDEYGNVFQKRISDTIQPDETLDFGSATKVSGVFGIDGTSTFYYGSSGDGLKIRVKTLTL